jgi:DNA transformation protein
MAVSASFLDLVKEMFAPLGDIVAKRMFGAAGLYCDGLFFAVIDDDALYLKTDAQNRPEFEAAGLAPAIITNSNGETVALSYYAAPEEVFEDSETLARWTELALAAARRAAAKKAPKRKKAPGRNKAPKGTPPEQ